MIILGIDPGTRRIGYGIIECAGSKMKYLAAGILPVYRTEDHGAYREIRDEMEKLLLKYNPERVGVEKIFFAKNQKTGIAVAQARGIIISAVLDRNILLNEVSPNEVKLGVTGYGFADKRAVFKMVRHILGTPKLEIIDDATDALAIAIHTAQISDRARKLKLS